MEKILREREKFGGWSMVSHINMRDKPHIMIYSAEYRGFKLFAKTGENAYCTAVDYPNNKFKSQDELFDFLDEKIMSFPIDTLTGKPKRI